jgi:hypothetical protein
MDDIPRRDFRPTTPAERQRMMNVVQGELEEYLILTRKGYCISKEVPDRVYDPPYTIPHPVYGWVVASVKRISYPNEIKLVNSLFSSAREAHRMVLRLLNATKNVSIISAGVTDEQPLGWSPKIRPLIKNLSISDSGGVLHVNTLEGIENLKTLKFDSRRGLFTMRDQERQEEENERDRSFVLYCLDHNTNGYMRPRSEGGHIFSFMTPDWIHARYITDLDVLRDDAAHLGTWIGNQKRLESLKLQYLNVIPSTNWLCFTTIKSVRLRRCSARLFWYYVGMELKSLTIQEPTSLEIAERNGEPVAGQVSLKRTIPTLSLCDHGLTYPEHDYGTYDILKDKLKHNLLEPLPDSLNQANAAARMKELSLQNFIVHDNDLTKFLAPFSSLTYLRVETTFIRILPALQSLTTLVLKDIYLETTTRNTNLFRRICSLKNLESLTLDNVIVMNSFRVNSPNERGTPPVDLNDIDESIRVIGVNEKVKYLTLGEKGRRITYREEFKVLVQRMFPAVTHLTFIFPPIQKDNYRLQDFYFQGYMKTPHTQILNNQRWDDVEWTNGQRGKYYRGWDLQMVKFEHEGIDSRIDILRDGDILHRDSRFYNALAGRLRDLSIEFDHVPELLATIKIGDDKFNKHNQPEITINLSTMFRPWVNLSTYPRPLETEKRT